MKVRLKGCQLIPDWLRSQPAQDLLDKVRSRTATESEADAVAAKHRAERDQPRVDGLFIDQAARQLAACQVAPGTLAGDLAQSIEAALFAAVRSGKLAAFDLSTSLRLLPSARRVNLDQCFVLIDDVNTWLARDESAVKARLAPGSVEHDVAVSMQSSSADPGVPPTTVHTMKGRQRHPMAPFIREAMGRVRASGGDQWSATEVWNTMQAMADETPPKGPVVKRVTSGIAYRLGSSEGVYKRDDLRKHLGRIAVRAPTSRT